MLEAQDKNIATIAEGMADIHPRIVKLEKTVDSLGEDMKLIKPAVQKNTKDIEAIRATLDSHTKTLERIEKRLDVAEARLST